MRETKFIEQNQAKWAEFEQMLRSGQRDPERLNELFIQVTDDLSYARTFYPNRSVRVYLNHLAQRIFHHIYRGKRLKRERLTHFWTDELPQVVWESRRALQLALALFVLSFGIGVLSSMLNPDFARTILGDGYVEMTLRNIENNDPMAVYKDSGPFGMSAGIALNNLYVALKTAIMGVLASIGTAFILISNGIMVGAFQYFFIERGLFWESFLTIWIHGTLEISAIVIAGGAGLVAGSGLLFPGTYTRTQAFQISMRRGLKIFLGIVPIIVLAAVFEGFLTRYTETPDLIRALFIAASAIFMVGYFVVLPTYKARRGAFRTLESDYDLPPDRVQAIDFHTIKSAGELISDAFTLLKQNLRFVLVGIPALALCVVLAASLFLDSAPHTRVVFGGEFDGADDMLGRWGLNVYFIGQVLLLTALAVLSFRIVSAEMPPQQQPTISRWGILARFAGLLLPILAFWGLLRVPTHSGLWLLSLVGFVFPPLWAAVVFFERPNSLVAFGQMFRVFSMGQSVLLVLFTRGFMLLVMLFLGSEFWIIFLEFFTWLVPPGEDHVHRFVGFVSSVATLAVIYATWVLMLVAGALQYFSNREIADARYLLERVAEVGTGKKIRGLAKE
jgi:uncharacterized membrane protein SpoIIM required for sporulation